MVLTKLVMLAIAGFCPFAFVTSAFACTCVGFGTGNEVSARVAMQIQRAAHIAFAEVISVKPRDGQKADAAAVVRVLEQFKGELRSELNEPGIRLCRDFSLAAGDRRVFFLDEDFAILGCTEYKPRLSDNEMIGRIRTALGKQPRERSSVTAKQQKK